jgi:integrase
MDDPDDYYEWVYHLRHDYDLADPTIKSYEDAVLLLLDEMADADWTDDIDRTTVDDNTVDVDDILMPDEIGQLTDSARHQRDVAFIEFLADTGARITLAVSLRVGDIDLDGDRPTYTPNDQADGLKGAGITDYPLIDSVAALRGYLRTSHPRPDDPDVALFHKIKPASRGDDARWSGDGGMRTNAMRQQMGRVADQAGVDKPTNPHAFRHAAISRMVREGFTRSQIEHRVHWEVDTDMWETYEHIASDEHNEDIFREAGFIEENDGPDKRRRRCGQCRDPIAPHHEFCPQCGTPVSVDARDAQETRTDSVVDELVSETDPRTRERLRTLLEAVEENPDTHADTSRTSDEKSSGE